MGNKLYVGNLSFSMNETSLQSLFAASGTVTSAKIISDRDTGRSKGFGFVEMSSASEAQAAIDQFNGKEIEGRALTVNEARPQEPRFNSGGGNGFGNNRGGSSGYRGKSNRY